MLTLIEKILFFAVLIGVGYLTWYNFGNMFKAIARGPEPLRWNKFFPQLGVGIYTLIVQPVLWRKRPLTSLIHAIVAWGFTLYILVNFFDVLYGFISGFKFFPGTWLGNAYEIFVDIFSLLTLIGVAYFLLRRFIFNSPALVIAERVQVLPEVRKGMRRDSAIVGFFILLHVGFRLLGASFEMAGQGSRIWQPVASMIGELWSGMSHEGIVIGEHVAWWLAIGLILAFIPYFPFSKHAHLFIGPLNHMLKVERPSPAITDKIDFEDEELENFGVAKLEELPQTEILDAYACIMCNRCQEVCPAYVTDKQLSPAAIEINKRYFLNVSLLDFASGKETEKPLLEWMLTPEAAWACTTCAACIEFCPVGNEPMIDIIRVRQDRVMMESDFPKELVTTFKNMENNGNPWGISSEDRAKWAEGLDVPVMSEKQAVDVLYWVGCAGSYDALGQKVSQAMIKILNAASVNYAILGNEETCSGDSAQRAGNEYLFQALAEQNVTTFKQYKFKKIVTQCPHCFNTIKNDYPQFDGNFEVVNHTDFILDLINCGKLNINGNVSGKFAYHDSCYLGRHNGIYDSPREILQKLGVDLQEMERTKRNGFCCGAGGARMWLEETEGKKINLERMEDVKKLNPEAVATACPFCATMLNDGIKDEGLTETTQSKDIAEYVAQALA
ncbi:MAG: 4Fe-4S dicluster domain-containing protein [Candidatus Marinimicrobia bacterium]|nr:4Fe-4S dicluster domain-containing protein [Candidatus Neomarinimicrobiota bacterium]